MSDYGHDLRFGVFLTPQNQNPDAVVDLAVLSEQAGLDLVTFQDHPYQPGFLDAWTLLTWVAARTERVYLAGNVLNLPLRPPAVLARAAASLDLLSGGRVEMGLGAGAFWDGIAAMGVERLTPGESVEALEEAIDILRGIWDAGVRSGLRITGEHYRVSGVRRGPLPAHPIPIHIGGYKPRMLRLIGRKADGWLPSLGYLQLSDIPESNAIIDEAAEKAGRNPREIQRLINLMGADFNASGGGFLQGPPEQWVEQLMPLVVEDGMSGLILATDNPYTIQRFGEEVAPALREAVSRERAARGTPTGPIRSAAALAKRSPDIDYESLPSSLESGAIEPGDHGYSTVQSTYVWSGSPGLVLQTRTPEQVAEALAYARKQDVPLAIRSGGHGISGRSTNNGGIVIDVGALDSIEVIDESRRLVRIGPGARWGEVASAIAPYGWAISSGDYGDVGVGGLATAGGHGFLSRSYGLTIDHVKGADVVLADGRIVRADEEHNPDLFWALRGAGGNMGVVTSFDIEAAAIPDVIFAVLIHEIDDPGTFLREWGQRLEASPRELTAFLTLFPGQWVGQLLGQTMIIIANDDTEAAIPALEPFYTFAPVLQQQAHLLPYSAIVPAQDNQHYGQARLRSRSALLDHFDDETSRAVGDLFTAGEIRVLQIRAVGGAVNDVDPLATAYAHRTQNFSLAGIFGNRISDRATGIWDSLSDNGIYLSFETQFTERALERAFPGETLDRLRRIKATYDPDNIFNQNFPIVPLVTSTT